MSLFFRDAGVLSSLSGNPPFDRLGIRMLLLDSSLGR